jgi:hypothetical protein
MSASVTIDDTHPLFRTVVAMLAGVSVPIGAPSAETPAESRGSAAGVDTAEPVTLGARSTTPASAAGRSRPVPAGGPHARVEQSAVGPKPAALPPDPLPPADTAEHPTVVVAPNAAGGGTQRGPAARSGTRPATVGPGKSKGGTLLPLLSAEPAATPPNAPPVPVKVAAAAGNGDAQCGTVGADLDAANIQAGTAGSPLPASGSTSDTAPDLLLGRTGAVEPEVSSQDRAEAAVAASPVVAKVVAMTRGRVEVVEAPPRPKSLLDAPAAAEATKRPAARGPRSKSPASQDAPTTPAAWSPNAEAMALAGF